MLTCNFDPTLISLGPIQVRWYGLMYVVGFILTGFLMKLAIRRGFFKIAEEKIESLITHGLIGMFLGARLFYVFIYNWDYYSHNLTELFAVWKGGLSFHGALAGMMLGAYIFARKNKLTFMHVSDAVALCGTPALFFGRMGNFLNCELYGRITDSPLGIIFPSGGPYPRHASQVYEGILEGLVLALMIYIVSKRVKIHGYCGATFLIGYSIFRFIVEYFREPDVQLGYYFGGTTTMGQILCLVMLLIGIGYLIYIRKVKEPI